MQTDQHFIHPVRSIRDMICPDCGSFFAPNETLDWICCRFCLGKPARMYSALEMVLLAEQMFPRAIRVSGGYANHEHRRYVVPDLFGRKLFKTIQSVGYQLALVRHWFSADRREVLARKGNWESVDAQRTRLYFVLIPQEVPIPGDLGPRYRSDLFQIIKRLQTRMKAKQFFTEHPNVRPEGDWEGHQKQEATKYGFFAGRDHFRV